MCIEHCHYTVRVKGKETLFWILDLEYERVSTPVKLSVMPGRFPVLENPTFI